MLFEYHANYRIGLDELEITKRKPYTDVVNEIKTLASQGERRYLTKFYITVEYPKLSPEPTYHNIEFGIISDLEIITQNPIEKASRKLLKNKQYLSSSALEIYKESLVSIRLLSIQNLDKLFEAFLFYMHDKPIPTSEEGLSRSFEIFRKNVYKWAIDDVREFIKRFPNGSFQGITFEEMPGKEELINSAKNSMPSYPINSITSAIEAYISKLIENSNQDTISAIIEQTRKSQEHIHTTLIKYLKNKGTPVEEKHIQKAKEKELETMAKEIAK